MEPQDIYFVTGVFLPLIGMIGYFTARAEGTPVWFPSSLFIAGFVCLFMAWRKSNAALTFDSFMDSTLRVVAAIL